MTIFIPPGSKRYCFKFMYKGKLFRGATGATDKRAALVIEKEARIAAISEAKDAERHSETATLLHVVSIYLDRRRFLSVDNEKTEKKQFKRLVDWLGPNTLISDIDTAALRAIVDRRAKELRLNSTGMPAMVLDHATGQRGPRLVSPREVNISTTCLFKRIYMLARDELELKVHPIRWKSLKLKEKGERTREISLAEEERFYEGQDDDLCSCMRFLLNTGMRFGNFHLLKWSNVDLATREITFVQKGERPHSVRIDDELMQILRVAFGKDPAYVFTCIGRRTCSVNNGGIFCAKGERRPVTHTVFRNWFKRRAAELGLEVRIHDLRRSAGSRMLRATGNLKATSVLLGHSSIAITAKHYAHIQSDDMMNLQNTRSEWLRKAKKRNP